MEQGTLQDKKIATFKNFKDDVLSWAAVNFHLLPLIFEARRDDYELYKSSIRALEIILTYFKDKDVVFQSAIEELNAKTELMKSSNQHNDDEIDKIHWDARGEILMDLVGRISEPQEQIKDLLKDSIIIKEIEKNLMNGIGQNIVITGKPGSGKSWSATSISAKINEDLPSDFCIDKNVHFTPSDFAKSYNDEKIVKEHSSLIFDDAGIYYGARDWQSKENKIFSKLIQIIRYRALLIIFTTPDLSFIDVQSRKMLHWWFETDNVNKRSGTCLIKPHKVQINQLTGDIKYPFMTYEGKKVSRLIIPKLDNEIAIQYEKN